MNRKTQRWPLALSVILFVVGLSAANWLRFVAPPSLAAARIADSKAPNVNAKPRLSRAYGNLPLGFEINRGQTDARVKFLARSSGQTLFLTADEAVLRLAQAAPLRLKLLGSNAATRISGVDELPTKSNYLIGNDSQRHLAGISNYARVRYENAWPGIELVWHSSKERQFEYDLIVAPGASVKAARLAFSGAQALTIDRAGALVLSTEAGAVRMLKPEAWQEIEGKRVAVACRYRLNRRGEIIFETGAYDRRHPLVIDPVLQYSTFLGGTGSETGTAIAVDASGNAYLTGQTFSTDFPGPSSIKGSKTTTDLDAYVLKLNPSGSSIIYATWIGGSNNESANALAVDASGNAYVTGETFSTDFPKTAGAFRESSAGGNEAFVVKLNPAGTALVYGTYLGGSLTDRALGIAVDGGGNAWVAGLTDSSNFPVVGPVAGSVGSARSGSAVYKSSSGNNWTPSSTGLAASSVSGFVADPVAANTFYAVASNGIFKTSNGGSSWSAAGVAPQINGLSPAIFAFVIDPKTPTTFYLATSNGVYKSVNAGQSFELRSTGLTFPIINALAIDPVTTTTLYAASNSGVFKTTNGGDSWTLTNNGLTTGPNNTGSPIRVNRFVIDPLNPMTIYVGADRGTFKTTNGGGNWIGINNGFTGTSQPGFGPNITTLIADPLNPATLYAGTTGFNGALYKSTNGGVSWQPSATGLTVTSGGNTFPINVNALAIAQSQPTTLYAATGSGVYKSTDGGANWAASNNGLTGVTVNTVFVDPNNIANVFAGAATGTDAFVAKLNAQGSALTYAMYLGGTASDGANGVAVDANGNAWVVGTTASLNFPTLNPLRATNAGGNDLFVAKLNATGSGASGSALAYSTYLGGSFADNGSGIALDTAGNVYLTGTTSSNDFPVVNALQSQLGGALGATDVLIAKLKGDGTALLYSTYLGGVANDAGLGIAVDAGGNAWVTGSSGTVFTAAANFPAVGALQAEFGGGTTDAFAARLNASGARLLFSSLIGGQGSEQGNGIAVDATGNAYITGTTNSFNFPTANPLQATLKSSDAFALKLALSADLAVMLAESRDPVMINNQLTYTATVTNNGPDNSGPVTLTDTLPTGVTLVSATASQGTCSGTATVTCNLGELAAQAQATVSLVITAPTAGTLSNRASVSGATPDTVQTNNSATIETRVSAQPSIAGRVTLGTGAGVSNVNVALSGAQTKTATTASNGFYQFADLTAGGNYTVTPTRAGFVFNPPQRSFTNVTADQTANFGAVACQFTITPVNRAFPATGGTGSITITSPDAQCPWTARSNVPWLTVTSVASGNGNAAVTFSVAATTAARSGTLTVAGNTFTVWQEVNSCGLPDFQTAKFSAAGKAPAALVSGDFNKDGKPDVAVANDDSKITVLLGAGQGTFSAPMTLNSYGRFTAMASGDFNGDGNLDLVLTLYDHSQNVVVHLGTGTGSFGNYMLYSAGSLPAALVVGDFNGDSKADLAVANNNGHNISILLGNGAGGFGAATNFGGINYPTFVTAGDFNRDNKLDLAVTHSFGLSVMLGTGTGALEAPVRLNAGFEPRFALVGDYNGDGRNDLLVSTSIDGVANISLLAGNGIGGFSEPVNSPIEAGSVPRWLAATDLNGDGKADLVAGLDYTNSILSLFGNGTGSFTVGARWTSGLQPFAGAVADFTSDGRPDVITSSPGRLDGNGVLSLFTGNGNGSFTAAQSHGLASSPVQALAGDFNGDGRADLIAVIGSCGNDSCGQEGAVVLKAGDGAGNFRAPTSFRAGKFPVAAVAGDFNNDNRPDLAVLNANEGSNNVAVMLNNGTGGFNTPVNTPISEKPITLAAGDFNNDGKLDLVVGHLTPTLDQVTTFLLGNGSGGFSAATISTREPFFAWQVGDLNGDGKADLIASNVADTISGTPSQRGLYVLLGNGNGTFEAPRQIATIAASKLLLYDFNGDGKLDVAVAAFDYKLAILFGDGVGGLAEPINFPLPQTSASFSSLPRAMALGDFNNDGRVDVALTNYSNGSIEILTGNGTGGFGAPIGFVSGENPDTLAVADFNGDGRPDLAVANRGGGYTVGYLTVFQNACLANSNNAATTVSAADYSRTLASEAIAAVFGTTLATSTQAAATIPLPTTLGGTTIVVRDSSGVERFAPLFFVSPTQINYQLPPATAPGVATVTIRSGNGTVSAGTVQIDTVAPAVFTANASGQGVPTGYVLRVKANGAQSNEPIADFNSQTARFVPRPIDFGPESDQLFLILFGTGIRNRSSQFRVTVTIGGVDCEVLYAGAQGGFVGLDQLNLRLPRSLAGRGETDVVVKVEEKTANTVKVSFR